MSDRPQRQSPDADTNELDFTGLLPGDDQPRRRRTRRQSGTRSGRQTSTGASDHSLIEEDEPETGGEPPQEYEPDPPDSLPDATGERTGDPATIPENDNTTMAASSTSSGATSEGTSAQLDAGGGGEAVNHSDGATDTAGNASTRDMVESEDSLATTPDTAMASTRPPAEHETYTSSSEPEQAPETGEEEGRTVAPSANRSVVAQDVDEDARQAARDAQAALVEGRDLDRILQRVSTLLPEERAAYKSTLLLSEEHYELLTDMRKEFRRRGFKGRDTTLSNVISVGLEVMRETLDAERNLPGH